jgi:hypothetical protein
VKWSRGVQLLRKKCLELIKCLEYFELVTVGAMGAVGAVGAMVAGYGIVYA